MIVSGDRMTTSGESASLDGFAGPDPAERSAFNRLFYRNRRPTSVGQWVSQFFCWWARLGVVRQNRVRVSQRGSRAQATAREASSSQRVLNGRQLRPTLSLDEPAACDA